MVEEEAEAVLRNALQSAPPRQPLSAEGAQALRGAARKQAETNIKRHLVLDKVAETERLQVTDEDIDLEIRTIAERSHIPLARAMESFQAEGRRDSLKHTLRNRRAIDFLVGRAIIN